MWTEAQEWEREWWGNCANTYGEETKQLLYADRMGLVRVGTPETAYNFDVGGASVIDIGGGPVSLLLKCLNVTRPAVVDPLRMPPWVVLRYEDAGIDLRVQKGEVLQTETWDEAWIYNVLEHTEDPAGVIRNARRVSSLIRLFEWIDTVPSPGHPHTLSEDQLNAWLNGEGKVETFARGRTRGRGYYGIFPC